MGMRVEAVWKPREQWGTTPENIDHFQPTGEPDAPVRVLRAEATCEGDGTVTRRRRHRVRAGALRAPQRSTTSGVEMLVPVFRRGAGRYRAGQARTSTSGAPARRTTWPGGRSRSSPRSTRSGRSRRSIESHVEMDGAWALYEAYVKILTGEAETALVYGFGKSSAGHLRRVLALQLDPYLLAPLWPDSVSIAALQARLGIEAGLFSEKDMAEVAARSRAAATAEPVGAGRRRHHRRRSCSPRRTSPIRCGRTTARRSATAPPRSSWPPATGPASCATGRRGSPASRTGSTPPGLGERDLTTVAVGGRRRQRGGRGRRRSTSPSCTPRSPTRSSCCARARPGRRHQDQPVRRRAVRQPDVRRRAVPHRRGRRSRSSSGRARRALGHATSGPALQQNLVCVMEATTT